MFVYGIIVALTIIILDQLSKWWLISSYQLIERGLVEITPFFNLVVVYNHGVSFGMLRDFGVDNRMIMIALTSGLTVGILVWLWRTKHAFLARGLGLVIGGAIGNIIDRIRFGAVFDFLDFHFMGWHWPAFNIADSAIFIGVCLILLDSFLCNTTSKK
jgi:signal peptidase II